MPATPSISQAAIAAMLAITSFATRTTPAGASDSTCPTIGMLHPLDVGPGPGVDLHHVSLVHEQRDLDAGAGLQPGRLGGTRDRVAPQARVGLLDGQADGDRQLDSDH